MEQSISDILTFLHRANCLKKIVRFKSCLSSNRDTAADHSWRLALMVMVIATELGIPVDLTRALQIALIHDLAELKTDDIDAYDILTKRVAASDKHSGEMDAMHEIVSDVSFGKSIFALWQEYEQETTLEATFVKALDKIEGFLHLDEMGVGAYLPGQFYGDYADAAVKNFDEVSRHFPPLAALLDPIKNDLKQKLKQRGIAWVVA